MTSQTTNFRIRIDYLIQCAASIKNSAETTLAWRSLQMAKAWLGKALAAMGQPSPYSIADNPGAIPPTADTTNQEVPSWGSQLDAINDMRQGISELHLVFPQEEEQKRCYQKAADYLTEAKMWYGFELNNIRESNATEVTDEELNEKIGKAIDEYYEQNPEAKEQRDRRIEDAMSGSLPISEVAPHFSSAPMPEKLWHDPFEGEEFLASETPSEDEVPEPPAEELRVEGNEIVKKPRKKKK